MIPQTHITAWRPNVHAGLDSDTAVCQGRSHNGKHRDPPPQRSLVDSSTFSVFWAGRSCPLRRTILFRLAERVGGQPVCPIHRFSPDPVLRPLDTAVPAPTIDLTRTPYVADFPGEDGGKTAHYMLRWVATSGEKGPPALDGTPRAKPGVAQQRGSTASQGWSETGSATIGA